MLHEFALDPGVLTRWQSFRYLIENFGVPCGRMISRFPRKWQRMVIEACRQDPCCMEIERKRIEEKLTQVRDRILRSNRRYDSAIPWLENAEGQQNLKPFHAIISSSNPRAVPEVLIADELEETTPLWHVKREVPVPRKAEVMAQELRPLLQACAEVLFIDPHFNPEMSRYCSTFERFFLAMEGTTTMYFRMPYRW